MLITSPFIMTFLPRRFEIVKQADAREIFSKVYDYYFLMILIVGLALSVFADEIMRVMTTPEFYQAGRLVPLIVLMMLILGMKYHYEFGILYRKKTQYYSYINTFTAVVHLLLNLILIGTYGIWGAVYASLAGVSLSTALIYWVGRRLYPVDFDFSTHLKMFGVAVMVYAVSRFAATESLWVHIVYKSFLFSAFPFLLIWMGVLSDGEINRIKQLASNFFQEVRFSLSSRL